MFSQPPGETETDDLFSLASKKRCLLSSLGSDLADLSAVKAVTA